MRRSQVQYKKNIEKSLIDISWALWNRLGTYGPGGENKYIVDIESTILLVAYTGWLDGRLFDGALSWISKYQEVISSERLKLIIDQVGDGFLARCLGPMIELATSGQDTVRWNSLLKHLKKSISKGQKKSEGTWINKKASWVKEDKIFSNWGVPKERTTLTHKLKSHTTILENNPIIRYRYLFGTSARPDVVYLMKTVTDIGQTITTSQLAKYLGYHHSSIFRIIQSLEKGGMIERYSKTQARDITWGIAPSFKLYEDTKPEKGIINWKQVVKVLLQLLKIIETIDQIPSEELKKHTIHNFHSQAFPILHESGLTYITPPHRGPLMQYTSEDLISPIETFITKLAKDIKTT